MQIITRMTQKYKKYIIVIALFCIGISIVSYNILYLKSTNTYLSFTTIDYDNSGLINTLNIYYLEKKDFGSKDPKKIVSLPYDCSYPAGVYDKKKNCIYYSYRGGTDRDKVFKYDCASGKSEVFLDEFDLINDISINNDGDVCVIGSPKGEKKIIPFIYKNDSNTYMYTDIEDDMCYGFNFSYNDNSFIFTCYQNEDRNKKLEEYNNANFDTVKESDFNIKNHIYVYNVYNKNTKLIHTVSTGNIPTITYNQGNVIYGQRDGFSMDNMDFFIWNDNENNPIEVDDTIIGIISLEGDHSIICVAVSSLSEGIYEYQINSKRFNKCLYNTSIERIQSAYIISRR